MKVLSQLRDALEYFPDFGSSDPQAFARASFLPRSIGQFRFDQDPLRNFLFPNSAWKGIFGQIFVAISEWIEKRSLLSVENLDLLVFSDPLRSAPSHSVGSKHLHPRSSLPRLRLLRRPQFWIIFFGEILCWSCSEQFACFSWLLRRH